jgi:hypothetical protein
VKQISQPILEIVLLYHHLFLALAYAAFNDVFNVKTDIPGGGCIDNQVTATTAVFEEATNIIHIAQIAFQAYNIDLEVRKLALSFFGIQMDDQMAVPKDQANTALLVKVQRRVSLF